MNDSTWTWISGSNTTNEKSVFGIRGVANVTNTPSARYAATTFVVNENELWMFGGWGFSVAGVSGSCTSNHSLLLSFRANLFFSSVDWGFVEIQDQ
jgi:hypothetical protein